MEIIMKNILRRTTALLIAVITVFSLVIMSQGAELVDLNDNSVFLKQQTGYTCTLSSALMMFRRGALINENTNWDSFTEKNYRKSSWWPSGLSWRISAEGMSAAAHKLTEYGLKAGDLNARRAWFKEQLEAHPEGIMIYCKFSSSNAHAVLLTDYDAITDTFYCSDPSQGEEFGRIPLGESELPDHVKRAGYSQGKLSSQDYVISYIFQVWVIESGIDYSSFNARNSTPKAPVFTEKRTASTGDSALNVRIGPGQAYKQIGSLKSGTNINVLKQQNGWGYINQDNVSGWISLEYTTKVEDGRFIMAADFCDAYVFGEKVSAPAPMLVLSNRAMAPARFVAETLGGTVTWEETSQKITVTKGELTLTLFIDSADAYIGDKKLQLDYAPFIKDGISYAPIRFIAEALGFTADWNPESRQLTIE